MSLGFELLGTDGAARRGRLATAHGTVETPAFMPIGTAGTVKAIGAGGVAGRAGSANSSSRPRLGSQLPMSSSQ